MKKRIFAVVMAAVVAFAMFGCGSKTDDKPAASTQAATEAATSGKVFEIATDTTFAPFEFQDKDGNYVGIDMDIIRAIAEDQGFQVKINPLGFSAALAAVESGQADGVIAGASITEERQKTYDFSDPYYTADVAMAVAKGSDIKEYKDLEGKNVAIKTGTNGGDFAKSIMDKYGFTVTEFEDSSNMYQDVIVGNSVACFEDYPVMAYGIQQGLELQLVDGIKEAGSQYGFAVKKGENAELLAMFNKGLKNIKDNGKYDEIVDKYTK